MESPATVVPLGRPFGQLSTRFDERHEAMWVYMEPRPRACFTVELLEDLSRFQDQLRQFNLAHRDGDDMPIQYFVGASAVPGIFNLGGDLDLFMALIEAQDREGLERYARMCIEVVYGNAVGFDLPVTTISLVQGDALGGGFEAALSCQVLIAEERARFGLPEVLFNLFPGMGAYSLLSRRVGPVHAERLILSGKVYSAEEMHEAGIVDVLVPDGEGEAGVEEYIRGHRRRRNAQRALARVRDQVAPIRLEELEEVGRIWADAALNLESRDLRLMRRLVLAQGRRAAPRADADWAESIDAPAVRTR